MLVSYKRNSKETKDRACKARNSYKKLGEFKVKTEVQILKITDPNHKR